MMYFLRSLGFVWQLPATILVWSLYILPFWIVGALRYEGSPSFLIAQFVVTDKWELYHYAWVGSFVWSGPSVIIVSDLVREDRAIVGSFYLINMELIDRALMRSRTIAHGERHCQQQFSLGVFYFPVYALYSVWITLFLSPMDPYLDNPLEVSARVAAGQPKHPKGYRVMWW